MSAGRPHFEKNLGRMRKGSSLAILLAMLSILTLLIVSLLVAALFDGKMSANALELRQARMVADVALAEMAAKLDRIPLDRHWAAGPGLIEYDSGLGGWAAIELFSKGAEGGEPVNLNGLSADGVAHILPANEEYATPPEMKVGWVYVRSDGSLWPPQNAASPVGSTEVPGVLIEELPEDVVGRFAYWADTENSRVNLNTAGLAMTEFQSSLDDIHVLSAIDPRWNINFSGGQAAASQRGAEYSNRVWQNNFWMHDRLELDADGRVVFANAKYPVSGLPLQQAAWQNTMQNLVAHPSSVNLSYLDGISEEEGFNTFRFAGSYFLRADAVDSVTHWTSGTSGPPVAVPWYGASAGSLSWVGGSTGFNVSNPGPAPDPDLGVRFFQNPEDWKLIVGEEAFRRNKGYITTKGRTPELTPWGLPKYPLTMFAQSGNTVNSLSGAIFRGSMQTGSGPQVDRLYENENANPDAGRKNSRVPYYPFIENRWHPTIGGSRINRQQIFSGGGTSLLRRLMGTSVPGYAALTQKYGTEETEQIGQEMINYLSTCLDDYAGMWTGGVGQYAGTPTGIASFRIRNDDGTFHWSGATSPWLTQIVTGKRFPKATETSFRRAGTYGRLLINEIAMELGGVSMPNSNGSWPHMSPLAVIFANEDAASPLLAPRPYFSELLNSSGDAVVFLLRRARPANIPNPALPAVPPTIPNPNRVERWMLFRPQVELFFQQQYGMQYFYHLDSLWIRSADVIVEVKTDDPVGTVPLGADGFRTYNFRYHQGVDFDYPGQPNLAYLGWRAGQPEHRIPNGPFNYLRGGSWPPARIGTTRLIRMGNLADGSEGTFRSNAPFWIGPFTPGSEVQVTVRMRFALTRNLSGNSIVGDGDTWWAVVPGIVEDYEDNPDLPGFAMELQISDSDTSQRNMLTFEFPEMNVNTPTREWVSFEADDPRIVRRASDFSEVAGGFHTLGIMNDAYTGDAEDVDSSDFARPNSVLQWVRGYMRHEFFIWGNYGSNPRGERQSSTKILGLPGVGYLSSVPTGVDSNIPWKTMNFQSSSGGETAPDWLLWSMLYVPFDRSFNNQTDGKMNINARLHPFGVTRTRPLQALLGDRVANPEVIAENIANRSVAANAGSLVGSSRLYIYPGQITQVAGVADGSAGTSEYERERLPRDLADLVSTQCDDFRVFLIAETGSNVNGRWVTNASERLEVSMGREVDDGTAGYPFPDATMSAGLSQRVVERQAYQSQGLAAPKINLSRQALDNASAANTAHLLGASLQPNAADNRLVPQRITINSIKKP